MSNIFDQFDSAKKTVASAGNDATLSFAQGANGLLKAIGDIYGLTTGEMDNWASKQGQENIDYLQRQKSPEVTEAEQRRQAAVDAETEPHKKAWAYVANTAPEWRLVLGDIAAAAPSVVGSGGAGAVGRVAAGKLLGAGAQTAAKVGMGSAMAAGAGLTAADAGAQQYAEMVKTLGEMPDDQAMQIPQIAELVQEKKSTIGAAKTALALSMGRDSAALAGLISAATMMVPGSNAAERAIVGGAAGKKAAGGLLRTAAKDALGETTQELAENVGAEGAKNIVARKVEPERELTKGMGEAAGASIIPAAAMGGMGGVAGHARATPAEKVLSQPVSEGKPTAGIPEEPPTPVATRSQLTDTPQVDLTKVENLSEDQFWAAVDARQTMQTGVELPDYQKGVLSETEMPEKGVDPELSGKISQAVESLVEQWKQENPEAADLVVSTVFDPNMLHNGYGIRGAYNRNSQSVLLNAAFLQEPEMVERVLNHEWAHATLATEEGKSALQEFAKRSLPEGELEALSKQYNTDNLLVLVDEWIAKNQEQAPGFIANMVQQVREWLAKFGIVKLTDKEVASVMLRSLRQDATGTLAPTTEEEVVPSEEAPSYSLMEKPADVAGRREKLFRDFKAANPRSDAVMEGGRLYSPAVRDRLKNLLATGEIDRRALDREVERNIPAASRVEIPTKETLPTLNEIRGALDEAQRSKVGGASKIADGDAITVRQDVPAYSRHGVGVVTVQDSKGNKYYEPFVRFTDPVLKPTPGMENASLKIGAGESKTPTIVVRGKMSSDRTLPSDLENWTQIGYNPDRHSYMYDRDTGKPVLSGSEAVQIGNTVFVKDAEFGDKKDFRYSLTEEKPEEKVLAKEAEELPEEGDPDYVEEVDTGSTLGAAAAKHEREDLPPTSALNTLYAKNSSVAVPEKGKRTNGQVAEQLRQSNLEYWGRKVTASDITPEEKQRVIANGVEEVLAGLKASNHAGNWYTTAIRKAMAIARVLHPELGDDAAAKKAGFKDANSAEVGLATAMAITSQNLDVESNTNYANEQFDILKKTGRFDPSKVYGSKAKAISGNLELANNLLDRVGWEGMEEFLNREYTVKELNEIASKVLGKEVSISGKVDDVVNGSAIFGPKIGGGFFQNLRANFNPVTVDLWMRRTWGRWTGDVLPEPLDAKRLARMLDAMRQSGVPLPEDFRSVRTVLAKKGRKVPTLAEETAKRVLSDPKAVNAAYDFAAEQDSRWNKIYSEVRQNITPEQAEAVRNGSLSLEQLNRQQQKSIREKQAAWQNLEDRPAISSKEGKAAQKELFAKLDAKAGRTATLTNDELSAAKPEWAKAARVITTLLKPVDVPSDIDRRVIVDVVNGIRQELTRRGVSATNADIQAILWYPEKDLWAKLGGKPESKLKSSYDEEFLRVAESKGLGKEARDAAAAVRD